MKQLRHRLKAAPFSAAVWIPGKPQLAAGPPVGSSALGTFISWARQDIVSWSATLNLIMAFAAIGGMAASVLYDLPLRTSSFAGSDMKTLFASVWCFAHGLNAYALGNVESVFAAHGIVLPDSWFGHAPVYPPTTLALLVPLAAFRMVPVVYGVIVLSAVLFAIAVAALLHYAAEGSCPLAGRAAIAALCAGAPVFSFALSMGNVSVTASALSMLCFVRRKHGSGWLYGTLLALAVLLKPHLAIWMLTGMLLLPEAAARSVAIRAIVITGGFASLVVATLAAGGRLGLETYGFAAILRTEASSGSSMNTSSREILPIYAQITSLHSLFGFSWAESFTQSALVAIVLVALGSAVAWRIRVARTERKALLAISTWVTFGLLATYHRAHDGLLLLLLLPWLFDTIRRYPKLWHPWIIAVLYSALSFSVSFDWLGRWMMSGGHNPLLVFLLLRQAALANLCLLLVLLVSMCSPFMSEDEAALNRRGLRHHRLKDYRVPKFSFQIEIPFKQGTAER